jgi:hypothetical protein
MITSVNVIVPVGTKECCEKISPKSFLFRLATRQMDWNPSQSNVHQLGTT